MCCNCNVKNAHFSRTNYTSYMRKNAHVRRLALFFWFTAGKPILLYKGSFHGFRNITFIFCVYIYINKNA